jgi:hypothetical protein
VSTTIQSIKAQTMVGIPLIAAGVLIVYTALLLCAAGDLAVLYLVLLVVAVLLDVYLERAEERLRILLESVHFAPPVRGVLLPLSLALLMVRHFPSWGDGHVVVVVLAAIGLPLSRSLYLAVLSIFRSASTRPMVTRNIDLGQIADPPLPPRWLLDDIERRLLLIGAVPVLVGAVSVLFDTEVPFVVVALAYLLALAAGTVSIGVCLLRALRLPSHAVWEAQVLRRIRDLRIEVVLYFSGSDPSSVYQINMWLETLERLPYRSVVLLREREILDGLAPTTLPVACMPFGVSVMQAGLVSAKVALYPAHTSKNIHMLREPGIKHVFIGHGDSDKVSSVNPFTRVYDQVWVAGRAGRDRWARARVGVRDDAIVEVGRPQLDVLQSVTGSSATEPLTVLYAPTWEGWNDQTFFSSITQMGPVLVRALLDLKPAVRVIYKPHPFTGTRDPRAARAHHKIVRLLAEANRESSHPAEDKQLGELAAELERPDLSVTEARQADEAWARHYWTTLSTARHAVVNGTRPTLYDCFNHADVLIADVSSVVTDFLATGKPYVCANPQGTDAADFRRENPTADAAYLLSPDCSEVAQIIELVRGPDPNEADRATLREYLLGPQRPPSIERWKTAMDVLIREHDDNRVARSIGVDEEGLEVDEAAEHAASDSPSV